MLLPSARSIYSRIFALLTNAACRNRAVFFTHERITTRVGNCRENGVTFHVRDRASSSIGFPLYVDRPHDGRLGAGRSGAASWVRGIGWSVSDAECKRDRLLQWCSVGVPGDRLGLRRRGRRGGTWPRTDLQRKQLRFLPCAT